MNKIILIDDDLTFKDLFQAKAADQQKPFQIIYKNNFNGLKELMPKVQRHVCAVVLDVKCLMTEEQAIEDEGFIGAALTYLDSQSPGFPRIILTGDDDAFLNLSKFYRNELIFQKTPNGLKDAFEKLNYYAENSEDLRLKNENSSVFALFQKKYFNLHNETTLLNVLKESENSDFSQFGGILRDIRALQETIYKNINLKNKKVVPNEFIRSNGMLEFNKLMKHLNGNPPNQAGAATTEIFQNSAIFNLTNSLYWTCGKYIHAEASETYYISNYTLKAMIYSLMELFIWSEIYLK